MDFHLDNFDGPLDLLLHLISKNKVSIYDIPIAEILEQYMAVLREAETIRRMENSLASKVATENPLARTYVDYLLGRVMCCESVDELRQYAPLYIVRGNNDKDWAEAIPHDLTVTLGGVTFFMVHNRKEVPADLAGVDAVVFGHSHKYVQEEKDGVLWLNPGSCGPRRFHQEITMMTAEAEDGKIRVEKVIIPHGTA